MGAIYANTLAKINMGGLLTPEKYKRLAEADYPAALKMLADYGYGGGTAGESADVVITRETNALIAFIENDCASPHAARALMCRFVYSNAKVLYKSRFVSLPLSEALYNVEEDLTGIPSGEYASLSPYMAEALETLDGMTPDPRTIDVALTRARFREEADEARKSRSGTLVKYVTAEIDLNNILTMFRCNALGLGADAFADMFVAGGSVDEETLAGLVGADRSVIAGALWLTPYDGLVSALCEKGYGYLAEFETGSDDYLYMLTEAGVASLDKFDVFLRYVLARLTEFKMVKMILTCVKNGVRDEIQKRMRCLDE